MSLLSARERDLLAAYCTEDADGLAVIQFSTDHSPAIVYANEAFQRMHVRLEEEDMAEAMDRLSFGIAASVEIRMQQADGSAFWAELRLRTLAHDDGCGVLVVRNVTERYQRFERMSLLSNAIDEAGDFVILTNAGRASNGGALIVYANRAFLEATGFSMSDIVGRPHSTFFAKNDTRIIQAIDDTIEMGKPHYHEIMLRRKDGSSFWAEFVGKPFLSPGEGVPYRVVIGRDITLRRRSQSQVSLLMAAIEHSRDRISLYERSPDGEIISAYDNAAALEHGGRRLPDILKHPGALSERLRRRIEAGDDVHHIITTLREDGTRETIDLRVTSLCGINGVEGIVTIERHLSDQSHSNRTPPVFLQTIDAFARLAHSGEANRIEQLRTACAVHFAATLDERDVECDEPMWIDPVQCTAGFIYDNRAITLRWNQPLDDAHMTALRRCIEAATPRRAELPAT